MSFPPVDPTHSSGSEPEHQETPSSQREILVIDDDESLGKLIVRVLQKEGYQAKAIFSGTEAVSATLANRNTLLLIDNRLVDMTGLDVIESLAAQGVTVPFVIMTGQGDEHLAVKIMKSGALDYLVKDIDFLDLLPAAMNRVLKSLSMQERLKQAETSLAMRLREKEVLLREIHHRVKNNLAIIVSLLGLQSDSIVNPEDAILAFEKTRDRIMAMALIHQKLYESDDCSLVDVADYLETLTYQLFQSYCPSGRVSVDISATGILLEVDQAIPIGLILNELLTNSLQYAFPEDGTGKIQVQLLPKDQDLYVLRVSDNGVGLPPGCIDSDSLGFTLVRLLVDQLGGALNLDTGGGTCFEIDFPRSFEPISFQG